MQDGFKRVLAILPRRAGKDITALNYVIRQMWEHPGVYYYIFPTYSQGKKVIWDSMTNDGKRILDYFPEELVLQKNSQEMKIRMRAKDGQESLFQLVGSDNYDSLMGTNPRGVVFSEYALQDPRAYQYIRPILTANQGWALFISTPRGKNHLWQLAELAKQSPEWFYIKLSVEDTNHIPMSEIERERREGLMSEDMIQQEYYTSFEMGVEGAYYTSYLDKMRREAKIGIVPWENGFKVHTAWDIGVHDSTTIIFFQCIGQTIRIIDCYENSKQGLEHYAEVIASKPYLFGTHIAPHDIKVKEWGSGITRFEKARQLGIKFTMADDHSVPDGIEACRSLFSKLWIDEKKCENLIKALENYRQEYDSKRKVYKPRPLHDWSCFTGDTLILTRNGMRPIMNITSKDLILTQKGWYSCAGAKKTGINAPLVEVKFRDGTKVKCTPEHKFLTVKGWISAEHLMPNTEIQSASMNLPNILRDICIDCGLANLILKREGYPSIGPCGNELLDLFLTDATFTTKTAMQLITHFTTLNAFQKTSILKCLGPIIGDLVKRLETLLQNGTDRNQEDYGIKDMPCALEIGPNGNENLGSAYIAPQNLNALLERMDMSKSFAIRTANLLIIESVKSTNHNEDVYCINVPTIHHFSLQNGAIVHNSHFADAFRYLAVSLPKTRDGLSKEELEDRYQKAMHGPQGQLPSFFRDGGIRGVM